MTRPGDSRVRDEVNHLSALKPQERTGIALLVLSCVAYASLIGVPFLAVSHPTKIAIGVGLAIAGEGSFWIGCAIAGKDFMMRLRKMLWPAHWKRRART